MNFRTILFFCLTFLVNILVVECRETGSQESQLPKEMPSNTEFRLNQNGGMSRSYKRIVISEDVLTFEELNSGNQTPTKWSVKISIAEKKKLYQLFVTNEFDLIKNDERKGIVYDAGSQGIVLTIDDKTFSKSYGPNHPMSGDSLKHYQIIANALNNLVSKYADKSKTVSENYVVLDYEKQGMKWIFKNAKSSTLNELEIDEIMRQLKTAVDDYNSKSKSAYQRIDLSRHKQQIFPVINEKGEKEVWVNNFCNSFGIDWRRELIAVDDGGNCYFNFKINLKTKKYYDFSVNGEA